MTNFIITWIAGQTLNHAKVKLANALFSDSLCEKLVSAIDDWRKELPDGQELLSAQALFPTNTWLATEQPLSELAVLIEELEELKTPSVTAWENALFAQWNRVRHDVSEPQAFFKISPDDARNHLRTLAAKLERECHCDRETFQIAAIEILKKQYVNLQQISSGQDRVQSAVSELDCKLNRFLGAVTNSTASPEQVNGRQPYGR